MSLLFFLLGAVVGVEVCKGSDFGPLLNFFVIPGFGCIGALIGAAIDEM